MKTKIKIVTVFLMLFAITLIVPQKASAQGMPVTFQVFYDELSPYGSWLYTPEYGYVWLPNAEPGFFPYATDGYWAYTDAGWTWVSFYTWGWAPFHYGRWFVDSIYGPMWVPGYNWAPAWVVWGVSGDCYGWAPLGPGVDFDMAYGRHYHIPGSYWRFVPEKDFGRRNIYHYYIDNASHPNIVNHYTLINNRRMDRTNQIRYGAGPDMREVERYTGRTFSPVAIRESTRPAQEMTNNQLLLFKPRVEKIQSSGFKPAPSYVANLQDLKNRAPENSNSASRNEVRSAQQKQDVMIPSSNTRSEPAARKQPREITPAKPKSNGQFKHQNPPDGSKSFRQVERENPSAKLENTRQFRHQNPPDGTKSFVRIQPKNPPAMVQSFSRHMEIQRSTRPVEARPMPEMSQMSRPESFSAQRGYSHFGGSYMGRQARPESRSR